MSCCESNTQRLHFIEKRRSVSSSSSSEDFLGRLFMFKNRTLSVKKINGTGVTGVSGTPGNNIQTNGRWNGSLRNGHTSSLYTDHKHRKIHISVTPTLPYLYRITLTLIPKEFGDNYCPVVILSWCESNSKLIDQVVLPCKIKLIFE